ncbi:Low temperature viability protein-domain-containing protein [Limtongia smithiae]|uniref:Low temperature viability protein-domain-containing protein n=1 Tax=Limtongia smithiae TaxID=1125753 RepID=UPI0034CE705F
MAEQQANFVPAQTKKPSNKRIVRKNARKFQLVYRSQEDPLIHDSEASTGVWVEVDKKPKFRRHGGDSDSDFDEEENNEQLSDSEIVLPDVKVVRNGGVPPTAKGETLKELEADAASYAGRRENEGEAAMYGIMFDDSGYDYMQHLREIGRADEDGSTAVFIPAPSSTPATRKAPTGLQFRADEDTQSQNESKDAVLEEFFTSDTLPSTTRLRRTYQDQQAIPDAIAGLQPDMDPDLREVLEALDDDAFVDEDEDIFAAIVGDGDAGQDESEVGEEEVDGEDWEAAFKKFKLAQSKKNNGNSDDEDDERDALGSLVSFPTARKQKGAHTLSSGYSMSSSAMFRNEGLTLLDDRFEQIERMYMDSDEEEDGEGLDDADILAALGEDDDDDACSVVTTATARSQRPATGMTMDSLAFTAVLDDFLDNYQVVGRRIVKESAAPTLAEAAVLSSNEPVVSKSKSTGKTGGRKFNKKYARGLAQLREVKEQLGKPELDYVKNRYKIKS